MTNYFHKARPNGGNKNRILSIILAISIIAAMFVQFSMKADAGGDTQVYANLVFFVRFSDEAQGTAHVNQPISATNTKTNLEALLEMYNGNADTNGGFDSSFKNYIRTMTNGKIEVENYFPQISNGTADVLTLSGARGSYEDDAAVVNEIIAAVSSGSIDLDDSWKLDNVTDGVLDNLTVIIQTNASTNRSDAILTPHKSDLHGEIMDGYSLFSYNFLNTYSVLNDERQGVISHEFMHVLGLPDLYREFTDGSPVGNWDLMSVASRWQSYILAYQRMAQGWIEPLPEITANGTYTLYPVSNPVGDSAFIIRTPLSETEFFVVEYRKACGNSITNIQFDTKVFYSGVIVYRINTVPNDDGILSNRFGKDYIYVFRPGETGLTDSNDNGTLIAAALSSDHNHTSIGTPVMTDSFDKGTIFYSDGRNSGIVINNVGSAGDTISLDVTFPDYNTMSLWEKETPTFSGDASSAPSLAKDSGGNVYIAVDDLSGGNSSISVFKKSGASWDKIGASFNGNTPVLRFMGDTPYVLYLNSSYRAALATYNGSAWTHTALTTNTSTYIDMIECSGEMYMVNTESVGSDVFNQTTYLCVRKLSGGTITQLGENRQVDFVHHPKLCVLNNTIYLLCCDTFGFTILSYGDSTWSEAAGVDLENVSIIDAATDGGKLYVAYSNGTGNPNVFSFDGTTSANQTLSLYDDSSRCSAVGIDFSGGRMVLTVVADDVAKTFYQNDGVWTQLGENVSTSVYWIDMLVADELVYNAVLNNVSTLVAYVYSYPLPAKSVPVQSVTLSESATVDVGGTVALTYEILPADCTDSVLWASLDPETATVSNGVVTGVKSGTVDIVLTVGVKSAVCTVTVRQPSNEVKPVVIAGASKLAEPWGIKYIATYGDAGVITDRGIVFLKETYYTAGMTPSQLCENEHAFVFTQSEGGVIYDPKYSAYSATLTEGIYSYDISARFYTVPFADTPNGRVFGVIKQNSMQNILTRNLNESAVTEKEKAVSCCILALRDTVAVYYAENGVPAATEGTVCARGSSQTAAPSIKTPAQAGVAPNVFAGASKLVEPWGLKYLATYENTGSGVITDKGMVMLHQSFFDAAYTDDPDAMRLNENSYVFTEQSSTLALSEGDDSYYALLTDGMSSRNISDLIYVVPYAVLGDGSYVYGAVKSNSMLTILTNNSTNENVSAAEQNVCKGIIALYHAVSEYYS